MRVAAAYEAVAVADRPEVFIALRPSEEVAAEFEAASGPLAGLLLAVKNNVDVAGIPTTAACPAFADTPALSDAQAVARLRAAGATVLGATNLDQFATGLVGQRSPYGKVRDSRRTAFVSGGSSSGSAVAVALGFCDIAIGTDTAGSGRVPAAFQGIVGIKPTLGVVSTSGVVPACPSWDAVTIFARDLGTASAAMGVMAGGPGTRDWPSDAPVAAPAAARVAIPDSLPALDPGYASAFADAADRLRAAGCVVEPIPFASFLAAATLLYDGALVAERHAAVGAFVDAHRDEVDPTVGAIIGAAGSLSGSAYVRDIGRLAVLRAEAMAAFAGFDALLVPTAPTHPSIADVEADPVGVNSRVGTYTNFCNLFDMCAVAVPSGTVPSGTVPSGTVGEAQFGVTVLAPAFHDAVAADLAARVLVAPTPVAAPGAAAPLPGAPLPRDTAPLSGDTAQSLGAPLLGNGVPWTVRAGASSHPLLVVGAHLLGQPLEHELRSRGALWGGPAQTAPAYSLRALDTTPPKPGLVRVASGGAPVAGELWHLSTAALGSFLAALPAPMNLGKVELSDGTWVTGFGCAADAAATSADITLYGGWRAYLAAPPLPAHT